ncbi:hypothetical protein BTZ20_3249 [Rhodococcus sp. MTM3W5.2]|nr:hypothetical protein BTZ20_3249 [Rhodococcus sp. MTM3W5.2]
MFDKVGALRSGGIQLGSNGTGRRSVPVRCRVFTLRSS